MGGQSDPKTRDEDVAVPSLRAGVLNNNVQKYSSCNRRPKNFQSESESLDRSTWTAEKKQLVCLIFSVLVWLLSVSPSPSVGKSEGSLRNASF